jgi:hypothetical protein
MPSDHTFFTAVIQSEMTTHRALLQRLVPLLQSNPSPDPDQLTTLVLDLETVENTLRGLRRALLLTRKKANRELQNLEKLLTPDPGAAARANVQERLALLQDGIQDYTVALKDVTKAHRQAVQERRALITIFGDMENAQDV